MSGDDNDDNRVKSSPIIRLLDREVTDEDRALAERLGRLGGDHRLMAARLVRAIETEKETSAERLADDLSEALKMHDSRLDALALDVRDFKRGAQWGKAIAGTAITIAIAVAGFVVMRMLSDEELKGEFRIRLDHGEDRARKLEDQTNRIIDRMTQPRDK